MKKILPLFVILCLFLAGCSAPAPAPSAGKPEDGAAAEKDNAASEAAAQSTTGTEAPAAAGTKAAAANETADSAGENVLGFDPEDWETVLKAARGTTVTHVGYGGDDALNEWLLGHFKERLKEKFDLNLEFVPSMEFPQKLATEKQAGQEKGSYDTCWINGILFRTMKEGGLLYGPIADKLPNYSAFLDTEAHDLNYDFTEPIEGMEAPFSSAQLTFIHDSAVTPAVPKSAAELMEFAKKYKGKVTYPSSEHFTGAAFIRTIIYELCGYEAFMDMKADKETVKKAIKPALDYLRALNSYLWKEGTTFPAGTSELDNMFINGEAVLMMSYGPYDCGGKIQKGIYPETAKAFIFDQGTVGNLSYYAIPWNAPNKAGALVLINEMLDPEVQLAKLDIGEEPFVTDLTKVPEELRAKFAAVDLGPNNPSDEDLSKRLPEYSAAIESIVTELWLEEVVGKTN